MYTLKMFSSSQIGASICILYIKKGNFLLHCEQSILALSRKGKFWQSCQINILLYILALKSFKTNIHRNLSLDKMKWLQPHSFLPSITSPSPTCPQTGEWSYHWWERDKCVGGCLSQCLFCVQWISIDLSNGNF